MKKKSTPQSAFFNLRFLIGLFVLLAGVFVALLGFGVFPSAEAGSAKGTNMAVARPAYDPAGSQMSVAQSQTRQARTVSGPTDRRALAIAAKKLYEPLATQVFNLAATRAASVRQSQSAHNPSFNESLGEEANEPTLTIDREDYPPFSYVYISGTGFEPGESVNMIAVELEREPTAFQPWDVLADENGNFETSWYIFSEDLGATMQVTATGESSGLTASAQFPDVITAPVSIGTAINNPSSTTLAANVTAAVPVGNTIIVAASTRTTAASVSGVADNRSNVYTQDVNIVNGSLVRTHVFSAPVTTALSSGDTITVTFSVAATVKAASALSVAGLVSVNPLDRTATGTGSTGASGTATTGSTLTTSQADELLIGAVALDKQAITGTAGTNYTLVGGVAGGGGGTPLSLIPEYRIVSATGAFIANWSGLGNNNNYAAGLATY